MSTIFLNFSKLLDQVRSRRPVLYVGADLVRMGDPGDVFSVLLVFHMKWLLGVEGVMFEWTFWV
jgi:hypothetical protein